MHFSQLLVIVVSPSLGLLVSSHAVSHQTRSVAGLDQDTAKVLSVQDEMRKSVLKRLDEREAALSQRGETPRCTAKNVVFRREYGDLSKKERLDYIQAVQCLHKLPPKTPASVASGARSRFDDFVVSHMQVTTTIHWTGNFLPWHRWMIHSYEKALRDECGYKGAAPYWDWAKYADAPQDSPIFNGDPYSMGGNGEYVPNRNGTTILPLPGIPGEIAYLPRGLGGGVVTTGPFANWEVHLGPVGGVAGLETGPEGGFGYNPRLMRRDVGPALSRAWGNYSAMAYLLSQPDIDRFRRVLEGVPFTYDIGPHAALHWAFGLDPGSEVFTSPGDPVFYLHHANLDRMWSLWQEIGPKSRRHDLGSGNYSHITLGNYPPSRLATLDDEIDLGFAAPGAQLKDAMDTTAGDLCYFYF